VRRHALRNALLPVVTILGIEFAFLMGGLVVTEQVFNLNGLGKLFVDATARGDFNLIQGLVLFIATVFIFVNLLVDLLYGWLDPRIRLTRGTAPWQPSPHARFRSTRFSGVRTCCGNS
jgi:peptide/nickel transport system permease protein